MARIQIDQAGPEVLTAPALVWFEATALEGFDQAEAEQGPHDPSFTRITYVWTVEGGEMPAYSAPHLPDAWTSARRAYGKKVAFVFAEPDTTYRIRLWAIDESGHIGEAETDVTTLPDGAAHQTTICLDPSGRFADKPDGAVDVTSVEALQDAIARADGPCRALIARGQEIDDFTLKARRTTLDYVGTFGDPDLPRPVLRAVDFNANMFDFGRTRRPQVTLAGLDCRGDWDASTETGRQTNSPTNFNSSDLRHFTVWDCRFAGFGTVKVSVDKDAPWTGGFGNTEVTNWSGYGVFLQPSAQGRMAMVGCDIAQHPDALNHYTGGRNGLQISQGPIRIPAGDSFYFGASSFLARGGWSGGNDQEALRLNSRCIEGTSYIVERCTLEGGAGMVKMSGSNSRAVETPGNYLLDKVLLLSSGGKGGIFGQAHFGGTSLRNVVMVQLDVPNADSYSYRQALSFVPDQDSRDNLAEPVALHNCSVMNLRSGANDTGDKPYIDRDVSFFDFTAENNIVHAPSLVEHAEDAHAPISTEALLAGFTPRYRGVRPNFPFEYGTLVAEIGTGGRFGLPYPEGTDQAYWQALPASDSHHGLRVGRRAYFAEEGDIDVAFGAGEITITNTSDRVWEAEAKWVLRLDRKSLLPRMNTAFGNPTDRELPLPVPAPGSPAIFKGRPRGRHAYDDFFGRVRPGPSETGRDHNGDPRPTDGGTAGAIHV